MPYTITSFRQRRAENAPFFLESCHIQFSYLESFLSHFNNRW